MKNCIIILNYNNWEETKSFIYRIINYNSINKIIVVDNNSPNESFLELSKLSSNKVDVIKTDKNNGYGNGNNFGIKYAIKNYNPNLIIISNPDVIIEDDAISYLIKSLYSTPLDAITGIMVDSHGNKSLSGWYLPNYYDQLISLLPKIGPKIYVKKLYVDGGKLTNDITYVDCIPGSFFIIKSDVFQDINFFDNNTFLYGEETILGFKLKQKGYKVGIDSNVEYIHMHGQTINKSYHDKVKIFDLIVHGKKVYLTNYLKIGKVKKAIFNFVYLVSKYLLSFKS